MRLRDDQWLRGWLHRFAFTYMEKNGDVSRILDGALDAIEDYLAAAPPILGPGEALRCGICDFCGNEGPIESVPGSRTMAGFVACPACSADAAGPREKGPT